MKRILGLFLLAIGASVAMLGGGTAQAATCTVPGTHATIQFAVSDFACATINSSVSDGGSLRAPHDPHGPGRPRLR